MIPTLSVIVPVKDEAENVSTLAREIAAATSGETAEIIFVDDGSADGTVDRLRQLKTEIPNLRLIRSTFFFTASTLICIRSATK